MPPSDEVMLERHQREEARWLMLRVLYMARPFQASETVILRGLTSADLPVTVVNIRRELDYLASKGLIEIVSKKRNVWQAKLTAYGVDVVEYAKDAPAGIDRPEEV